MDISFLKKQKISQSRPELFSLSNTNDFERIKTLFTENKINYVVDDYLEQLKELFATLNPQLVYNGSFENEFKTYLNSLEQNKPLIELGNWVFYPWLSTVVHVLPENDFYIVRTSRNKNLINAEEQNKFYNAVVGIGGLSVGSAIAIALVLQGGTKYIKLADLDILALSNTNRIRAGVNNLGLLKVEMTARQIYEINPYAEIELFPDGLNENNMEDFFVGKRNLDVVIDEMDNLAIKYLLREKAKKYRLPIVMAADNGDNGVVDVERYDLNSETPFFHNRMGEVSYEMLKNLDKFGIGKMITKHVGPENVTERMQQSLLEMGKTIVSWPQLGGAAQLNGSAVAYCVRKIVNNQPLESNRAIISLDEKLSPNYLHIEEIEKRKKAAETFKNIYKL
ncbi:MAG: ThiF protein [Gammaproteobacteria bacterium]|jgi:molybdopterin/thiamine biosynthesis adenylyltransferase|nr:ThiF protein [Gammaproteobacteria bacterium]